MRNRSRIGMETGQGWGWAGGEDGKAWGWEGDGGRMEMRRRIGWG